MGKNEKTPITINGEEHYFEDLTEQQQAMVFHDAEDKVKMLGADDNVSPILPAPE